VVFVELNASNAVDVPSSVVEGVALLSVSSGE